MPEKYSTYSNVLSGLGNLSTCHECPEASWLGNLTRIGMIRCRLRKPRMTAPLTQSAISSLFASFLTVFFTKDRTSTDTDALAQF